GALRRFPGDLGRGVRRHRAGRGGDRRAGSSPAGEARDCRSRRPMTPRTRKPFIAGNWKMNLERKSALALRCTLRERLAPRNDVDVAVFPPFVYVDEVARALAGSPIRTGAQNCCDERSGAFTGEVSATMLADVGATLVILGHSERRHLYG